MNTFTDFARITNCIVTVVYICKVNKYIYVIATNIVG